MIHDYPLLALKLAGLSSTNALDCIQRLLASGGRQRLGSISKGNKLVRWLLVEGGQTAARSDPQLRRMHQRLKFRRCGNVAKVAIARKLAVRLYWMLREAVEYPQVVRMQSSSGTDLVNASSSNS